MAFPQIPDVPSSIIQVLGKVPGVQASCDDLLSKINTLLNILDPITEDLKKEVDNLTEQANQFTDEITDPLKQIATEIENASKQLSDLLGLPGQPTSLLDCLRCEDQLTEKEENKVISFLNELGEDIGDLGEEGRKLITNLAGMPRNITTVANGIATDFLNAFNQLPETLLTTGLAIAAAKYPGVAEQLDQLDCWVGCLAEMCPDLATEVDSMLFRIEMIRQNIKIKEDGTLDEDSIMENTTDTFKEWGKEMSGLITGYKDQIVSFSKKASNTFSKRQDTQMSDETGAEVTKEDTASNVRSADMAEYGWPAGSDGEYQVEIEIVSNNAETLMDNMNGLKESTKERVKSQSKRVIQSLDSVTKEGFEDFLKEIFVNYAPPPPRGKGNIPVNIKIKSWTRLPGEKHVNEETNLYWTVFTVSAEVEVDGNIFEANVDPVTITLRDTDFTDTSFLDYEISEMLPMIERMDGNDDHIKNLTPIMDSFVAGASNYVQSAAGNVRL